MYYTPYASIVTLLLLIKSALCTHEKAAAAASYDAVACRLRNGTTAAVTFYLPPLSSGSGVSLECLSTLV